MNKKMRFLTIMFSISIGALTYFTSNASQPLQQGIDEAYIATFGNLTQRSYYDYKSLYDALNSMMNNANMWKGTDEAFLKYVKKNGDKQIINWASSAVTSRENFFKAIQSFLKAYKERSKISADEKQSIIDASNLAKTTFIAIYGRMIDKITSIEGSTLASIFKKSEKSAAELVSYYVRKLEDGIDKILRSLNNIS